MSRTVAISARGLDGRLRRVQWTAVVGASLGNALEWFDLLVYGFFAVTIARLFFPSSSPVTSLLLSLGTFGTSFVVRPIGALVIGSYADRKGRRPALLLTIGLMMLGTLIIAVTPVYATIGVAAPAALVAARLIQGFSAGGEFGSATAFLAEQSAERRGFLSSFQSASQGLTTLFASAFGIVLTTKLSPLQLANWGWRVPFYFGLLIGPLAVYIRRHSTETDEFKATRPQTHPLADALRNQWRAMSSGVGITVVATVAMYLVLYTPTYAIHFLELPAWVGYVSTFATGILVTLVAPLAGHLADRVGGVKIAVAAAFPLVIAALPIYLWIEHSPTPAVVIGANCVLAAFTATYLGVLPLLLSELFPVQTRTTGLSISYNVAVTVFGGFGPFIMTWLISETRNRAAPGIYLAVAGLISLVALWCAGKGESQAPGRASPRHA